MRVCRLLTAFLCRHQSLTAPWIGTLPRPRHLRALGDLDQTGIAISVPSCVRARVSVQDILQIHDRHSSSLGCSLYHPSLGPLLSSLQLLENVSKGASLLGLRLSVCHHFSFPGRNYLLTLLGRNPVTFMRLFVGQGISTALLDFIIFAIPIPLYLKPETPKKTRLCLLGLFVLGSLYAASLVAFTQCSSIMTPTLTTMTGQSCAQSCAWSLSSKGP